jgi:3-hydroxymyristoyl/3-hydroxydecanoyl-(acyl carrier protein) dehydratase
VRRIAVRFSAPVYPGDAIELSVYNEDAVADGYGVFSFEASSSGQKALRRGLIEVATP